MTRWILAATAVALLLVSNAFAQGLSARIYYPPNFGAPPLTTECDGETPLPDGRIVRVFQDTNFTGPDPTDPQPTVCDNPPACLGGPNGTVNFNEFLTNGVSSELGAGYFITPYNFTSSGSLPPGIPVFYLRVYEPDGTTVLWTSTTFWLSAGYMEVNLGEDDMTCGQGGPQCLVIDETE